MVLLSRLSVSDGIMKTLIIGGDFKGITTQKELIEVIASHYEVSKASLAKWKFLIAYQDTGSWGCDSSSFFLLQEKSTGKYFEVHGSHCSCFGFEGQWEPEETILERFLGRDWYFPAGGYDDDSDKHRDMVLEYIMKLKES